MLLSLLHLFFPAHCVHCGTPLVGRERHLCLHCAESLSLQPPLTGRTLGGEATLSLLPYNSLARSVVHSIKYHNNVALSHAMGRQLGIVLSQAEGFASVDLLLPVPLHPKKLRQRGYNQCLELCRGIAQTFPRPVSHGDLVRIRYTQSQARLSHQERLSNLTGAFLVRHPQALMGKHILIVDDVLTTGATTAAVARPLNGLPGTRCSIATLISARHSMQDSSLRTDVDE